MAEDSGPDPVDVHVGQQIRNRRRQIGLSQEKVGQALGITFQQIQKYERGSNRVSASMLFHMAATLGVQISFFFEGLDATDSVRSVDGAAVEAMRAVPELALVSELPRDQQLALGKIIAAMRPKSGGA